MQDEFRFIDGDGNLIKALGEMLSKYPHGDFKPLVRTGQTFHFGAAECAAHAFMPQDGENSGWGIVVGDCYASWTWPEKYFKAWKEEFLSILPCEMQAVLGAVRMAAEVVKPSEIEGHQRGPG